MTKLLFAPRAADVARLAEGEMWLVGPGQEVREYLPIDGDWAEVSSDVGAKLWDDLTATWPDTYRTRVVPASLPTLDEPCPGCRGRGFGGDEDAPRNFARCERCGGTRRVPKDWHIVVPQWRPLAFRLADGEWFHTRWKPVTPRTARPLSEFSEARQVVQWLGHDPVLYPVVDVDEHDSWRSKGWHVTPGTHNILWNGAEAVAEVPIEGLRPGEQVVRLRVEKLAEVVTDMACPSYLWRAKRGVDPDDGVGPECAGTCPTCKSPEDVGRVPVSVPEGQLLEVLSA